MDSRKCVLQIRYNKSRQLANFLCYTQLNNNWYYDPCVFILKINQKQEKFESSSNRKIWGYLYNEYKLSQYYWETTKIVEKQFIRIVLAYYEDYIPIKAALVFFRLFLYSQNTSVFQPYMFNKIDTQSTTACAVSIILATTIYTAQLNELKEIIWPFYLIISILNSLFVIKLLQFLLYAYAQKLEKQLDVLRDKIILIFPHSVNRFPFLRTILKISRKEKKEFIKDSRKLRNFFQSRLIIELKNQNKILLKTNELENRESNHERLITSPINQDKIFFQGEFLNKNRNQN